MRRHSRQRFRRGVDGQGNKGLAAWASGASTLVNEMNPDERRSVLIEVERLREEHRDLDTAISALAMIGMPDQLQMQRLKRRKLILRDRIGHLADQITPDIIA